MDPSSSLVVIGNGSFLTGCLDLLRGPCRADVRLVVTDPEVPTLTGLAESYCERYGIAHLASRDPQSPEVLAAVSSCRPDLLVSAYNLRLLRPQLLELFPRGAINFHNGPLPGYRGLNVYSWAIANGEREHGVSWHVVDGGIDSGPVLGQKSFPLTPDDTPLSLGRKGFAAGKELLRKVFLPFVAGELRPVAQDAARARTYRRGEVPEGGRLDFRWPFDRLERLVRALDFGPLERPLGVARVRHARGELGVLELARAESAAGELRAGRIRAVRPDLLVDCADAVVELKSLLDPEGERLSSGELAERQGLRAGDLLTS
jgi:methionyl-tRNA formyltransferase